LRLLTVDSRGPGWESDQDAMPLTRAGPTSQVHNSSGTALHVATFAGIPPVVEIRGEIDIFSAPGLRDELLRVIRRCGPRLALDLAGVTFIDCAGINVLLATRRRARLEDGSVEVIHASPRVRRMISLLGLGWVLGLRQVPEEVRDEQAGTEYKRLTDPRKQ
jgi:anti-sigma B factor antagonist